MRRLALAVSSIVLILVLIAMVGGSASADSLPEVVFLGQGPGTYDTPLSNFIVKYNNPFRFEFEPGPTYELRGDNQRIWGISGADGAPPAIWEEVVGLGFVEAGCIVKYTGIDDDVDGRRNGFFINDELVELVGEGMVFGGSFVVPEDGDLVFIAEDSVGGWYTPCDDRVEPTATMTVEPTVTNTPTPGPSPTATNTPLPTNTATPGPSPTATSTAVPPTLEPTVTPTKRPREYSCVRINFEVSGQDAARGLYIVQESGGKLLASWYALDGWQDSGWFKDIDITHENVYVQVLYYRGPDSEPVELAILNHAPDSPYGWMSWGICHALEVAWPGEKPEGASVPDEAAPAAAEEVDQQAPAPSEESAAPPPPPAPVTTTEEEEDQGTIMGASLSS